jgi:NAD(P)-dependent dehydrogenase (short-subunit alcohol dehydrogenase family)
MILITGASNGLGNYLFNLFLSRGEDVYGTYNNNSSKLVLDFNRFSKVNISNFKEVENWINSFSDLSNVVLINCAGITYNSYAHKSDFEIWKKVIDVNLIGTFNVIRMILPIMRENNYGRIINFSSVVAQKPTPGLSSYAASKSALWGMTKSIAIENASKGITINNINLGYTEMGMIEQVPEKFKLAIKDEIPIGGFCKKEDVLSCVEFIIGNSYLTGSSIDLNGGVF